jgi:hypothetical protein
MAASNSAAGGVGLGVARSTTTRRCSDLAFEARILARCKRPISIRVSDISMTLPCACPLSAASDHRSISTGKERDTESGNDYFGARYYGSSIGRWLSPDVVNVTEERQVARP